MSPTLLLMILLAWLPVSLLLFWRLPAPRALVLCFLGGWALLPTAPFVPPVDAPSTRPATSLFYLYMPASVSADYWLTKATAIGIGGVAASLFFDRRRYARLRPVWLDLPAAVWCLAPFLPAVAGRYPFLAALRDAGYLLFAWGSPYLLGRLYLADSAGHKELALGVVLAGLCYLPICLVEGVAGPGLYRLVYGFHPYQTAGAERYVGYRPVGLLEDGNQLGLWLAGAALLALWLWRTRQLPRWMGIPPALTAWILVALTVASQSAGAILLLLCGVLLLGMARYASGKVMVMTLILLIGLFLGVRAASSGTLQRWAKETPVGRGLVERLRATGRGSLGWRLSREEQHIRAARAHLVTGAGRWDWFRQGPERPWGLWLLVLGMYGLGGLIAVYLLLVGPALELLRRITLRAWRLPPVAPASGLAILLCLAAVDSLLNAAVMLPWVLAVGALADGLGQNGSASLHIPPQAIISGPERTSLD